MLAPILLLVVGCSKPPEAPTELDSLSGFLFEHFQDEDPEALTLGVENLDTWLGNHLAETAEGYTVSNLSQAAVDALDDRDRDLTGLVGAAVGNKSAGTVDDIADAIILSDPLRVFPDTYEVYDREFAEEPECFIGRECGALAASSHIEANYPLGLKVTTEGTVEYRWIETEAGDALLQRSWLNKPADVNFDWLKVNEQYFLSVSLAGDKSVRLQATWIVAEVVGADVPDATALNNIVSSMQGTAEALDTWMVAH